MDTLERIRRVLERHGRPGGVSAGLPGLAITRSTTPSLPEGKTVGPSLGLIVQGSMRTVLAEQEHRYEPGQYVVVPVALPVTCTILRASEREPYLALALRLDPAVIAELVLAHGGRGGGPQGGDSGGLVLGAAGPGLLDALARLVGLLDRPHDAGALAPLYEREILWTLLTGEYGALVRGIGLSESNVMQVSRAIGWIRAHYGEPLRVEELAAMAAMSVRSFHRHFREITRMTPVQYQKQLRLQEARARLLARPDDVAGAGHAVGYGSASQFSREYRRMFGAPPGSDVLRLRERNATMY
jgi:AraC-like DNA-binding protein